MFEFFKDSYKNLSLFIFIISYFYFWRNSLTIQLKAVDDAFRSSQDVSMPFDEENDDEIDKNDEEDEQEFARLAELANDIEDANSANKKNTESSPIIYGLEHLALLSPGVLFKTVILGLMIIIFLSLFQFYFISNLMFATNKVEKFDKPKKVKKPKKNQTPVYVQKVIDNITVMDKYTASSKVSKHVIEDFYTFDYDYLQFRFLSYILYDTSYLIVAAVTCGLITHFYVKLVVIPIYMDRKDYVKSQVKVIHTINLIMFFVVFVGLKVYVKKKPVPR